MSRITNKDLEAVVRRINLITKSPLDSWERTKLPDGRLISKSNVGNYHLSYAYGGVSLHRMSNESGGVSTPINSGHVPKRELYNLLQAFLSGLNKG